MPLPFAPAPRADAFVALTKADLHLHLVGSAAPHTVAALAAAHPDGDVPADLEALRSFYTFRDFRHFLRVYSAVSDLVRTPHDIVTLVVGLADDLAAQGTAYAEVTVTPSAHWRLGIAPEDLAAALDLGARQGRTHRGVELAFVYDISAFDGDAGARMTLAAALEHPPSRLVGFGLGGPEQGVRRADFAPYFAAARAAGLHSLPHAGESVGPSEVRAAGKAHLVLPTRSLAAASCAFQVAAHPARLEPAGAARRPHVFGPFLPEHFTTTFTAHSILGVIPWSASQVVSVQWTPVAVTAAGQNCDQAHGIGFDLTVERCAVQGPNSVGLDQKLSFVEDFKVSALLDGFPIFDAHEFTGELWVTGGSYNDLWTEQVLNY